MAKTYWIAWNNTDRSEGAVFDRQSDAESALDGCDRYDEELGFSSISTLAERFYETYGLKR
jgi:hypothetical protein